MFWVDFASVVLISAATVLTAWCGYEAARWTAIQSRLYNESSAQRVAAAADSGRFNTLEVIDVGMFLQYVGAIAAGRTDEEAFIYRRFRPEMKRAVDAWLATKPRTNPAAPSSPFAMPQYRLRTGEDGGWRVNALACGRLPKGHGRQRTRRAIRSANRDLCRGIVPRRHQYQVPSCRNVSLVAGDDVARDRIRCSNCLIR